MSKPRELKLKVHPSAFGVDIVYDAAVSSWMFKEGEYELVEKSTYELLEQALFDEKREWDKLNEATHALRVKNDKLTAALKCAISFIRVDARHGHVTKEFADNKLKQIEEILK